MINDRAVDASIQERVPGAEDVRTFRMSTNTLGDGFVEAINSNTLVAIVNAQPGQSNGQIAGQLITVPVLEAPGNLRVGRFGWKDQNSSLLSFSADAYLNEIGITNRLLLTENTSMGVNVARLPFDQVPGNEDPDNDIDEFAAFMRASKVPSRDTALAGTSDAIADHSRSTRSAATPATPARSTSPAGTAINGGAFIVPGGARQQGHPPVQRLRAARYRHRRRHRPERRPGDSEQAAHDALWACAPTTATCTTAASLTFNESILRHAGEATGVINTYRGLSLTQRNQIIAFLQSL